MAKKKQEECPSIPGWLVSFGDLMSLLLTFFILLYAMSTVDIAKALKFLSYFQSEPQYKIKQISIIPPIVPFTTDVVKKVKKRIQRLLRYSEFQIASTSQYVMIRLFDDVFFEDNTYKLTPKAKKTLAEIANVIKQLQKEGAKFHIKVAGFTSSFKPGVVGVKDVWDLSVKRAYSVARYLMEQGIDPSLFFIAGYGDTRPLYTWNNPLLIRRNNRVEIYLQVDKKYKENSLGKAKEAKVKPLQ